MEIGVCRIHPIEGRLEGINGNLADRLAHFTEAHLAHLKKHHHIATLVQRGMFEDGPRRGKALGERVCSENFTHLVGILRHSPDLDIAKDPARYSRKVVEVILTEVQELKT